MIAELFTGLQDGLLAVTASPVALPALFLLCFVDGFFPPVPSETAVIALATVSATGQGPPLVLVLLIAAAGAFAGDLTAYAIGRKIPVHRIGLLRSGRGKRALDWAQAQIARRGGSLILAARYIPIGRVAVNITAGSVRYPPRCFALFAAVAALSWGVFSTAIGLGAGSLLGEHPLLASLLGIVLGVVLGALLDGAIRGVQRRRGLRVTAVPGQPDPSNTPKEERA
ncbi:DedA family protein [Leucobacter sp. M11]|uniref:DedA family protein n=1 Tax=Leucobacter sp. M11 TaxID=2993565 RepID=UPI002D802441|nr:VTT domain-containing protein [Leucobacter sp. M11]MEB4613660.1 VTT domain-containing protein [Leucobacter sp. M11]